MKNLFFSLFTLVILSTQTSCLPVLLDENLRTTSEAPKLDSLFNRKYNLQYFGEEEDYRWIIEGRNNLYVGIAVPVRIKVPMGHVLKGSNVLIEKDNSAQDLYYLTAEYPAVNAVLTLEQLSKTENKSTELASFYVRPMPTPTLQLPIKMQNNYLVSAYDLKHLDNFSLKVSIISKDNFEFYCPCTSFILERIDKTGKRQSAISKNGDFNQEIKDLLALASSQDVYMFRQVTSKCSKNDVSRTLPTYAVGVE